MKRCSKCGRELEDNLFSKGKNQCKKCLSEYNKEYRKANADSIKERKKEYRKANADSIKERKKEYRKAHAGRRKEYDKEYRKANADKQSEYDKEYRKAHANRIKERKKEYRKANADSIRERCKEYRKANADMFRKYNHKRRAKKRELPATLTVEQWRAIKESFGNKCAYCGKEKPLEQEHFHPLSKGGEYTHNNIIPACKSCNSSKCDKLFDEWYPTFEYYSKARETKIKKYLGIAEKGQGLKLCV